MLSRSSRSGWLIRAAVLAPLAAAPLAIAAAAHSPIHRRASAQSRPAAAHGRPRYSISIQAVFDLAGNPAMVANFSPDGSLAVPEWSICRARSCSPEIKNPHGALTPGPEPAGTVFRASATYRGHTYTSTRTWRGRVQIVSLPQLDGRPRVGSPVAPAAGSWRGGWGTEFDQLGVEACRTARGGSCVMLSGGLLGCGRDSARVPVGGWFTGWFLFAVDARSPSDEVCAGVGIALPADLPVWPVRQTIVRSLPVGRVTGPPPPRVWILRHAIDRGDRVFVARVQCSSRCNVSITVENRTYEQTRRVALIGNKPVSVPRARLRPGSLLVSVNVDSGPTVSRRSELS